MDKIDYSLISSQPTMELRWQKVEEEINRVDYVIMTDAQIEYNRGGHMVLQHLGEEEKHKLLRGQPARRYKLRAIKDEWGNHYKPGDIIKRKIEKDRKTKDGRKYTNRALKKMKQSGQYDQMFVTYNEYEVDKKGCIDVTFEDAGYFLMENGIHYETGFAVCGKREYSREPNKAPNGQMLHTHYWLYQEVPPWIYEKLPILDRNEEPKKRGRKPQAPQAPPVVTVDEESIV